MATIDLPTSVRIKHIEWSLDRPAQVNRSAYTGTRAVVSNPWHGMWRAKVQLAAEQNPAYILAWKAFHAKLKGQINTFQLPATESPQYALGTVFPTISNHTNTTVTNIGSNTYTVEKTAGVDGYNAGAVSGTAIAGDFTLRIKHLVNGGTANGYFAGLDPSPLTDDNFTGIDHAFSRNEAANTWGIYENGSAQLLSLADATYSWIWRIGTTLRYGRGASLAVAQASPDRTVTDTNTLYFDSSLYSVGDKFEVQFSGPQAAPTAASGAAQGATSITLTGAPTSLNAGMLATVTLPSGNKQLVMLTQDMASGIITFEPPLREAISTGASVDAANPTCMVALSGSDFGWSVDPGTLYSFAFDVEEAF